MSANRAAHGDWSDFRAALAVELIERGLGLVDPNGWRLILPPALKADPADLMTQSDALALLYNAKIAVRVYEPNGDTWRVKLVRHTWAQLRAALDIGIAAWFMGYRRKECQWCNGFGCMARVRNGHYVTCRHCKGYGFADSASELAAHGV